MFSSLAIATVALASGVAQAQPPLIAGYQAKTDITALYLDKDQIQEELENIMGDEECNSFDAGKVYYNGAGSYLQTIPTYTGTISAEYNEYIQWAGGEQDFHKIWVDGAFDKTVVSEGEMTADFTNGTAFPRDPFGSGQCVGFEECVKKASSYVYNFIEVVQLMQAAIDSAEGGCNFQKNGCTDALEFWDGAAVTYVGSLEGVAGKETDSSGGRSYGKALYALADKRCRNFVQCGPARNEGNNKFRVAPINTRILSYFAAGQMAATNGDYALMEDYKKLISAKTVVPWIQGTLRYAWRLSSERARAGNSTTSTVDAVNKNGVVINDPDIPSVASAIVDTEYSELDKEVGEAITFGLGAIPKLWACSDKAAKAVWPELAVGGGVAGDKPVNFQLVKTAFECNYKCLLTSCKEVGSLYDGKDKQGKVDSSKNQSDKFIDNNVDIRNGAKTCKDLDFGTDPKGYATCKKTKKKIRNKGRCKSLTGSPGITKRDLLDYFAQATP